MREFGFTNPVLIDAGLRGHPIFCCPRVSGSPIVVYVAAVLLRMSDLGVPVGTLSAISAARYWGRPAWR
jgi:hypothetical protein